MEGLRIVGINGIFEPESPCRGIWEYFELAFTQVYPEAEFSVKKLKYFPWEGKKIRHYADAILEEYDDGITTILLGYSMGGVIATALEPRFTKTKISKVVTVFSPHTLFGGIFSKMCGSGSVKTQAPVISIQARFDLVVPWGSKYPGAQQHRVLRCDHLFGLDLTCARKIAETSAL